MFYNPILTGKSGAKIAGLKLPELLPAYTTVASQCPIREISNIFG
jgi:hypothetical protein